MGRDSVIALLRSHVEELRSLGVAELLLFGSFARDEAREDSDVDLLVRFDRPTFDSYMQVKENLEQLLQRKVDLLTEGAVKPRLRDAIIREAIRAA